MSLVTAAPLEDLPMPYPKADYIETLTGNRVNKRSLLSGSQNIRLGGKVICVPLRPPAKLQQVIIKQGVGIRGDLAAVAVGSHSTLCENVVLTPPEKQLKKSALLVTCSHLLCKGCGLLPRNDR